VGEQLPQVRLAFRASAHHVRTARLIAVAYARRSGRSDEVVEAVRQAVGEACVLALRVTRPDQQVRIDFSEGPAPGREWAFAVTVWPVSELDSAGNGWPQAVMTGLSDRLTLVEREGQSALELTWSG
jgi:hypothetical protein